MCQQRKIRFKCEKKRQPLSTLFALSKEVASKENRIAKYITHHCKAAGELTLKAGLPITILKGNQIIRREPNGSETAIASIRENCFIPVSQVDYTLK